MALSIQVRGARRQDRKAVVAFTQNTFQWGDYVDRVWDQWLKETRGQLLVAETKGRAVGLLHVAWPGNREAWMEGMRVHPDFRRFGVAAKLDAAGKALAQRAGCRVARLATAIENVTAQTAIERFGYRNVATFREWDLPAQPGEPSRTRLALPRELHRLQQLWEHSAMRRATHNLIPLVEGWRWLEFTPTRLRSWLVQEKVYVTPAIGNPRGFALVNRERDGESVLLVVGQTRAVNDLLTDVARLAHRHDRDKYWLMLPATERTSALAEAKGWGPQTGGMLLYESPLR